MMDVLPSILTPVLINAIAVLGLYIIAASGRISVWDRIRHRTQ